MALSWITLPTYADGDPVDEGLLDDWYDNTQWLKFIASSTDSIIVISDAKKGDDIVVDESRDWRDLLILVDGYAKIHGKQSQPDRFMPGGQYDDRLVSGDKIDHNDRGMEFWSLNGGVSYNSAGNARGEWRLYGYFDFSYIDFFVWVASSTGVLMASCKATGGIALISDEDQLNALMVVRARDDIV